MPSQWRARRGAMSRSICSKAGLVWAPASARKHVGHAPQQPAAQLERRNGVCRRSGAAGIGRNRRNLVVMGPRRPDRMPAEMLGRDESKRRGAERTRPFLEKTDCRQRRLTGRRADWTG